MAMKGNDVVMTNKELAAQCLIEAANILNESSGKHGIIDRALKDQLKGEKSPKKIAEIHDAIKTNNELKKENPRLMRPYNYSISSANTYLKFKDQGNRSNRTLRDTVDKHAKHEYVAQFGKRKPPVKGEPEDPAIDKVKYMHNRINSPDSAKKMHDDGVYIYREQELAEKKKKSQNESIDIFDNINYSDILD